MRRSVPRFFLPLVMAVVSFSVFQTVGIAAMPKKMTSHPAVDYFPAPSQDGRFLAFVSDRSGNQDIWLKSLGVGTVSLPRQLTTSPAADRDPALNSDGTRLLYVSHKTDPRGDIYLLDILTGKETQLTDLRSGDSLPQWGPLGDAVYYLKQDLTTRKQEIYRRSLRDQKEQEIVKQASAFAVSPNGWIIYSDRGALKALNEKDPGSGSELTAGIFFDVWPALSMNEMVLFTRYQDDTNGDGRVDADDQSSIWMGQWDRETRQGQTLYRMTPSGHFHLYPAEANGYVYFSDLQRGDIFRLKIQEFVEDYSSFTNANELATLHIDQGHTNQGLLVLDNVSRNLAPALAPTERAAFDFAYAEMLMRAGQYTVAQQVLAPYAEADGNIGALAQLHTIVLNVHQRATQVSSAELKRLVEESVTQLMTIGSDYQSDEVVYGQALIEAGRLYLLVEDPLSALDYLVRVDELQDKEIRAKALFTRGTVYRGLGDEASLLQVFVDVIHMFGETSSWGKRAVAQAIAVSEQGEDGHQQVASLTTLIDRYPDLTFLSASTRLRIADLYDEQGEQLKAIQSLDQILQAPPPHSALVERGYRRKAKILAASEHYQEAAEAYAALVSLTGKNQAELDQARTLMVLQLVRKALKDRSIGEVRIAAKGFKRLTEEYPESVEAHRGYIETKVMLKEIAEVQTLYTNLAAKHPDNPAYLYSKGLALSYSQPPNFPTIIELLENAIQQDPGVSYFHQTLGWAYEQEERLGGKKGYLEKAEEEYRIALELNDGFQFPDVESNLLLNLGNTYMALNNFREAYRHYHQRETLRFPVNNTVTELLYRKNYGEACFKTGRSEASITQYQLALQRVPADQKPLKAELLERIGLSQQDLGNYSEAVQSFSQAMEINLELGRTKNLALLQRNIGVNLYNLSTSGDGAERASLKKALQSYFASLDYINQFGVKEQKKGTGLLQLEVALGEGGSQAAKGFDQQGEQKLIFSYIAGTYEKLSEPAPAREYYLKKLALLPESSAAETDVARFTEKAVVLNRIGLLSHQLGMPGEALDYIRQSLGYTRALKLPYGTGVNLYNISRLATEHLLSGEPVDWSISIIGTLVTGLEDQLADGRNDLQTFYALANTAFLLHNLPDPVLTSSRTIEDHVKRFHDLYTYKSRAWSYYTKAQAMFGDDGIFSNGQALPTLVMLKLNMMELALEANQQNTYEQLHKELTELVEGKGSPNGWLWYLAQAERTEDAQQRKTFLRQAFEMLVAVPPQVYPKGSITPMTSSLDRLSALYVDLLVEEGEHSRAFAIAEQIAMRKVSALLYDVLGEEFFLKGLGEYQGELRDMFVEMRKAFVEGQRQDVHELAAQLEEIIFALYEEYPWAVPYFTHYAPNSDILSVAINAEHPYLKIVQGTHRLHGFLHDGTTVQYVPLEWTGRQLQADEQLALFLAERSSVYVSVPESLERTLASLPLDEKPLTRVISFYDFVNGYHQRSLFYANVAVAGDLTLDPNLTAGEVQISGRAFAGTPDHDRDMIQTSDVLITTQGRDAFSFELTEDMKVREFLRLQDLAGGRYHTALLFNHADGPQDDRTSLVSALLRAGFPHVIVHTGTYDQQQAQTFASLYLAYLADLPPHEALTMASHDVFGERPSRNPFVLYGYAGMDEEEKAEFASSIYADEIAQAVTLYQNAEFKDALQRMEHALSVIDYADKGEDFGELTKLAVDASFKIGDYDNAVFHQEKLLNVLGDAASSEEKSEALYRLGILYSRLERFDVAIQHLEQAVELWRQAEELDRLAEGIATLGVIRENMGAYSDALADFGRSFELYQEIGEIGDMATQYRRIGRIYYLRLGRYERARENFLAALESYRELEDRQGEAETLYEIGLTYEKMGLFEEADQRYRDGKSIGEELDDPFLTASGHLYLANTAWFRGNYQDAFQFLLQAGKLAEQARDAQLTIMVKNTRGLIYWTLNDTDKGLTHLKQAVTLAEEADIKTELASSLNNLGLIYRQREDYVTSLEYFEKAKGIDEQLNSRWGLGYDYRNIGMSLLKLNRLEEAEANFVKAEQTSAEIKNAINWVKALLELGNVNRSLKKPAQALKYYDQAYELSKQYGIKEIAWRAAGGKAAILREKGDRKGAFTWYADAITIVEGMRASLKIDELRNSFQANKQDLYRETIALLVDMGRTEDAFNYLERSRSRSFIDLLGNQKLTLKNEADQQALNNISALSSRVDALKTELGSYDDPPADLVERYRETKSLHDEAIVELKQNNPGLSSFVAVDPLTQAEIERLLTPGVGLLSYMLTKDKGYLWLLQQKGTTFYEIQTDEQEITKTVTQYRNLVQHLEPVDDELKKLYGLLIKPVTQDLEGWSYLGIIPDGPLHFLSFSALKDEKGYLVDRYPLFYTPSASVLKFTFAKREGSKATKVLAVGNPDLGNYNYDLPLAELEAQSIRWNYPDMDILTGVNATKEWFVENIPKYGIIHLATHGEFDEFNPLFSSLWLASKQADNRRLTVKEVFGLEINADLVTLSACQTGLGKLEAGELIGLNRAFIYAGTHALVSALWRVDDLSTSVLMKHFYRNYVTMDKAKSLRQAQLIVKKEFPHPSYWAGFSLVGDYQ